MRAVVDPDTGAGEEPAQLEGGRVEIGDPRIARVEHLEPAVEEEAVDPVGRQPAPDVLCAFQDATSQPAAASRVAVDRPARPAPITTTSARAGIVTTPT
ncbi:hypothetical protein SAMN05660662_2526 [Blastococcus aurantiacus]|uniref:Uncharacterized protein n=1 Tax=Blastococcus aurantiacus TaxID=1550231 RepID=A0A1G7LV25_9ACTN|nr:hypothetical protein SAMN05660662_2526 [Blastococcus aurantiacus]